MDKLQLMIAAALMAVGAYGEKFSVVTWNVGHYSMGLSPVSRIPTGEVAKWTADYCGFLEPFDAKLVFLSEYSPFLDREKTIAVRTALFGDYNLGFEGPFGNGGHVNSLYVRSGVCVANGVRYYRSHYQNTNYNFARLKLGGVDTLVVATHLEPNWPENHRAMRAEQIAELLAFVGTERHVIIAGDFNVEDQAELKPFADAGFALANDGGLKTWHVSDPKQAIDNVIVRGFRISNARSVPAPKLSDHCLLSCELELSR